MIDVHFRAEPPLFAQGEAVVVAPVALELAGAQRVLEVASQPTSVRRLSAGGITALAWEYAGRVHRDMRFVGVAFAVGAPAVRHAGRSGEPEFRQVACRHTPRGARESRGHRGARAGEVRPVPRMGARPRGGIHRTRSRSCRLARAVAGASGRSGAGTGRRLRAALREGRFRPHWAQVAVVMAAEGVGRYRLSVSVTRRGGAPWWARTPIRRGVWILADVESTERGLDVGWPTAGYHGPSPWSVLGEPAWLLVPPGCGIRGPGVARSSRHCRARSGAVPHPPGKEPTDTTEARTLRLSEVCR